MSMYNTNALLEAARQTLGVFNHDPVVQAHLATYGFGDARRLAGQQRLTALINHLDARDAREQERWALSQQINAGLKAVREQLREHIRIARFALNDDPTRLHALRVDTLARPSWKCVDQAIFFYQQLQKRSIGLDKFGLSKKEVQRSLAAANALLEQKQQRIHRKGLAEHGTQQIHQAQADLRDWLTEFRGIARVAYRQQPQLLEIFGIRVRSSVKGTSITTAPDVIVAEPQFPTDGIVTDL